MSFVERIEAKVRAAIREEVRIHPSNPVCVCQPFKRGNPQFFFHASFDGLIILV